MDEKNSNELRQYPYNLLTDYFVKTTLKNQPKEYEIIDIFARDLIVTERIDLLAKWFYIDCKMKYMDMQDAKELYLRHIEAFSCGTFTEDGTEYKNSIEKYFEEFDFLIEDIRLNGFDENKSLIPIGDGNILLDGSHRCVCAAYFNKSIKVIKFKGLNRNYNYNFFRERLLDDRHLDKMVHQYCQIKNNIFLACIWPVADNLELRTIALEIIQDTCGVIVYHKKIKLNYRGIYNLMIQAYGHQSWVGNYKNKHCGIKEKADNCFKVGSSLLIVVFECNDYEKVLVAKKQVRDIYKIDNHSIHITDDANETYSMAELLLNCNSIHHLNYGNPDFSVGTNLRLLNFKESVLRRFASTENFIIDASAILAIYGLREAKDLDFLTTYEGVEFNDLKEVDNHEGQMKYYIVNKNDMLFNTSNYFVYGGVKFLSLDCLKEMKKNRNENKDKVDVIRIKCYLLLHKINSEYVEQLKYKYLRYRRLNPSRITNLLENILKKLLSILKY